MYLLMFSLIKCIRFALKKKKFVFARVQNELRNSIERLQIASLQHQQFVSAHLISSKSPLLFPSPDDYCDKNRCRKEFMQDLALTKMNNYIALKHCHLSAWPIQKFINHQKEKHHLIFFIKKSCFSELPQQNLQT